MLASIVNLTNSNIDSVFVNSNSVATGIKIQDETVSGAYPPNATFDVWALNSAQIQVQASSNVTVSVMAQAHHHTPSKAAIILSAVNPKILGRLPDLRLLPVGMVQPHRLP